MPVGPQCTARLLVASSDRDANVVMAVVLRRHGYQVEHVETLVEAESRLSHARFDLFVCRVGMPDGSGADAILRAWQRHQIPGVAMFATARSQREVSRIPRSAMRGTLRIPFRSSTLIDVIRDALNGPRPVAGAAAARISGDDDRCPDCRGSGRITLLLTHAPCRTCGGTGRRTVAAGQMTFS
jgi:CheY-like chemotaxis protein